MWWKLLQISVFLAVSFTGIYYEWTPNGTALGLVALMSTMVATAIVGDAIRLIRWACNGIAGAPINQNTDKRLLSRWRKIP